MTGVAKNTVVKLLVDVGRVCADYQDKMFSNLSCKRIHCDEIWTFCYAKERNVPANKRGQFGFGDVWTWVAFDAETKLVASFLIGNRGAQTANRFICDLASRLVNRVRLTTDGHRVYLQAVEDAFDLEIDYAMLVRIYGSDAANRTKYSLAECLGYQTVAITGRPDPRHVSTSYVERQNLTNAFSKKVENHVHAVALHFMHYNFCRIHQTLRVTPAMEADVADHVWSIEEMVSLLESSAKEHTA
jgi:IS1 family transposase